MFCLPYQPQGTRVRREPTKQKAFTPLRNPVVSPRRRTDVVEGRDAHDGGRRPSRVVTQAAGAAAGRGGEAAYGTGVDPEVEVVRVEEHLPAGVARVVVLAVGDDAQRPVLDDRCQFEEAGYAWSIFNPTDRSPELVGTGGH